MGAFGDVEEDTVEEEDISFDVEVLAPGETEVKEEL